MISLQFFWLIRGSCDDCPTRLSLHNRPFGSHALSFSFHTHIPCTGGHSLSATLAAAQLFHHTPLKYTLKCHCPADFSGLGFVVQILYLNWQKPPKLFGCFSPFKFAKTETIQELIDFWTCLKIKFISSRSRLGRSGGHMVTPSRRGSRSHRRGCHSRSWEASNQLSQVRIRITQQSVI